MTAWTSAVTAIGTPPLWWRLGDTSGTSLADASGNGRNGTRSGSTITTGLTGALSGDSDTAMSFTGTNPVGQIAYGAWAEGTSFSVCCWFKTGTLAASNILMARDHQTGGRRFQVLLTSTGAVSFVTINTSGGAESVTTGSTYANGAWHLVTCVYNGTIAIGTNGRLRVYVDNTTTPTASNSVGSGMNTTGTAVPFSVGNATRTTQAPANSTIDEVLYWPGTILTGAQHQSLWAGGAGLVSTVRQLSTSAPMVVWMSGTPTNVKVLS